MKNTKSQKAENFNGLKDKNKLKNPKYASTKLFTLKDLISEVDKRESMDNCLLENNPGQMVIKDLMPEDFIGEKVQSADFDELQKIDESPIKPEYGKKLSVKQNADGIASANKGNTTSSNKKKAQKPKMVRNSKKKEDRNEENKPRDTNIGIKSFENRTKQFEERRKEKQKKLVEEMNKVCSFKPQINKKSAFLDKKRQGVLERPTKLEKMYNTNIPSSLNDINPIKDEYKNYLLLKASKIAKEKGTKPLQNDGKYAIAKLYRRYSERDLGLEAIKKPMLI